MRERQRATKFTVFIRENYKIAKSKSSFLYEEQKIS